MPEKTEKGFRVPESEKQRKKKAAKETGGSQNARIEAKLDYIIALLEGGGFSGMV